MLPPVMMSPVPTYTTFASEGATATAPTEETDWTESKMGRQVTPASPVFHTPPAGMPA